MPPTQKHPVAPVQPTSSKTPRTCLDIRLSKEPKATAIPWLDFYPTWRIIALEMVDPFGWHEIDQGTLESIRQKLCAFETMTLGDIFVRDKKRNHAVEIHMLCGIAKQRLRELGYDDLDHLWTLRLTGVQRIWGTREGNVFTLLWWDPNHQVCPSLK